MEMESYIRMKPLTPYTVFAFFLVEYVSAQDRKQEHVAA